MPRVKADGLTVRDICNKFLSAKNDLVNSGEIGPRTLQGLSDLITTWGGRVRIRRGIFGGVSLGFDHWATDFAEPGSRPSAIESGGAETRSSTECPQ